MCHLYLYNVYVKTCTVCKFNKSYGLFNKKARSPDGYNTRCRECVKQWEKVYYKKEGFKVKRLYKVKNKEAEIERQKQWQKQNQHVKNSYTAKYRALKLKAMPKWLTLSQQKDIKSFYKVAKELTKLTNTVHHVDHIIPLNGVNCNGLHVPWNLQVITAEENIRKSNKIIFY